jgi:hypothetical protein
MRHRDRPLEAAQYPAKEIGPPRSDFCVDGFCSLTGDIRFRRVAVVMTVHLPGTSSPDPGFQPKADPVDGSDTTSHATKLPLFINADPLGIAQLVSCEGNLVASASFAGTLAASAARRNEISQIGFIDFGDTASVL